MVLAGGLGTRMKSGTPKVLHPVCGRPMIAYALEAALALKPAVTVIVTGAGTHERIESALAPYKGKAKILFAIQEKPLGTGHALLTAVKELGTGFGGSVIVLNGDFPLIRPATLKKLFRLHAKDKNALSLGSFLTDAPGSYGRVRRDLDGAPVRIVEKTDLSAGDEEIKEVNSGLYALEPEALKLLGRIKRNPRKNEYYITDILALARRAGLRAGAYAIATGEEFAGVNDLRELGVAEAVMRGRLIAAHSEKGARFLAPETAFVDYGVKVAPGAVVHPNVHLQGATTVGKGCIIYPNARIIDSVIKEGAVILDSSLIESSEVGKNAQVGPFAHLRPGSRINPFAKIGNFVEIKNSTIGKGTKAMHLSYIGDARVGRSVNIGAGTITCNYDGARKMRTVIEDGCFIGSDSQLVAPVTVKKGSYVAAGTTVTNDVPGGSLAISRVRQKNVKGYVRKKRKV
ncbi:MAG: bifunctional UDP-N-acetylglucosamine diphosphorylase/glucosamine-1-phosphate N-acetyltransferase GlmU [Nitrospiraceae bacterium]|nr:bifunctional UDP-N-acetylglucosamine diphosphorylase/glucosamine-1-phosphate N-acetyltransferase GlmU [Nitrospiraceae bacterium]